MVEKPEDHLSYCEHCQQPLLGKRKKPLQDAKKELEEMPAKEVLKDFLQKLEVQPQDNEQEPLQEVELELIKQSYIQSFDQEEIKEECQNEAELYVQEHPNFAEESFHGYNVQTKQDVEIVLQKHNAPTIMMPSKVIVGTFLSLLSSCKKEISREPSMEIIEQGFDKIYSEDHPVKKAVKKANENSKLKDAKSKSANLWTTGTCLHIDCTKTLNDDFRNQVKQATQLTQETIKKNMDALMPFMRSLNSYIVDRRQYNKKPLTVYRGKKAKYAPKIDMSELIGQDIRICEFMACSKDLEVALAFNAREFCYKINIPAYCYNGTMIADVSNFNSEDEVLIPPYSIFTVKKIETNYKLENGEKTAYFVELDLAVDNLKKNYFGNNVVVTEKEATGME